MDEQYGGRSSTLTVDLCWPRCRSTPLPWMCPPRRVAVNRMHRRHGPAPSPPSGWTSRPAQRVPGALLAGSVRAVTILGGLHHAYEPAS